MWFLIDKQGIRYNNLTQEQVIEQINTKQISQESLLWRRGFVEWRALKETELAAYLPATTLDSEAESLVQTPAKPATPAPLNCTRLEDILGAAKTLPGLVFLYACFQLGTSVLSFWFERHLSTQVASLDAWRESQLDSLQRIQNGEPNSPEILLKIILAFQLLASILFAFHWLRWQYRASKNALHLQLPFPHHPLVSLVWWFLPLIQLFMPWVVLKSLLNSCSASLRARKFLFIAGICWLAYHLLLSCGVILNAAILEHGPFLGNQQPFSAQFPAISQQVNQLGLRSISLLGIINLLGTMLHITCLLLGVKLAQHISGEQFRLAAKTVAKNQTQLQRSQEEQNQEMNK